MRIITGTARGRRLITPDNDDIRPTTDNVKESVFNIIQFDIEGRRVLDMFAGTGQLGIECLSRGAAEAVFIDKSREAAELEKKNLKLTGLNGRVIIGDALKLIAGLGRFDLIFVDPPYDSGLYNEVISTVNSVDLLSDGGIMLCECRVEAELPDMLPPYRKVKEYRYGKVKVVKYIKGGSA